MLNPFPKYAKTNHPEVLAAMEQTRQRAADFMAAARDLAEEITGDPHAARVSGYPLSAMSMVGFDADAIERVRPHGKWGRRDRGIIRPYKVNPIHQKMGSVFYEAAEIPGRGNMLVGQGRMGTGEVFEHEGYVYSRLDFTPVRAALDFQKYGWVEIGFDEISHALRAKESAAQQPVAA